MFNPVLTKEIKLHNNKDEKASKNNTGIIARGIVRKSDNQVKKHITQMSPKEIDFLGERLNKVEGNRVSYSLHLEKKNISFDKNYIAEIINNSEVEKLIVEYNETTMKNGKVDHRVVLRDTRERKVSLRTNNGYEKAFANLCIVLSLNSKRIITAYWNKPNDNHNTMDWSRYNANLSIC